MQQHPIILPFGIIDEVMDGPWLGSWPWRNLSSQLRRDFTSQLPHSNTQNVRWGTILKDPCGSVHHYSGSIRHKWRYDGRSWGLRVVLADGAVLPVTSCIVCNTRQWKERRRVEDSSGKKNIIIHCQHHHCHHHRWLLTAARFLPVTDIIAAIALPASLTHFFFSFFLSQTMTVMMLTTNEVSRRQKEE